MNYFSGDIFRKRQISDKEPPVVVCHPVGKTRENPTALNLDAWRRLNLKRLHQDTCEQYAAGVRTDENPAQFISLYADEGYMLCNLFVFNEDMSVNTEQLNRGLKAIHIFFGNQTILVPHKFGASLDDNAWTVVLAQLEAELKDQPVEIWTIQ